MNSRTAQNDSVASLSATTLLVQKAASPPSPLRAEDCSDDELVAAAQAGNSCAMEELLRRHRPIVYRSVRRFADTPEEADDLAQETMMRAFLNISRFRREARFSSWLVAIAINAGLSLKRKTGSTRWFYLDESRDTEEGEMNFVLPDHRPNPEQVYMRRELRTLLRREVSKQHPKYRSILRACDLNDRPIDEAAQELGISRTAAKSRLHRARHMLAETFQKHVHPHFSESALTLSPAIE
jgi:RNA polymerase sigma-70 factor (ECF subfamily)